MTYLSLIKQVRLVFALVVVAEMAHSATQENALYQTVMQVVQ